MTFQHSTFNIQHSIRRGQAALGLVSLIGGIVLLVGITLSLLAMSFIGSGFGYRAATRASAAAFSGVEDAILLLVRNKDYNNSGYTVPVGSDTATVSVTQNSPASGQATIQSSATASYYSRKWTVVVAISSSTGNITVISWQPGVFP